MFRLLLISLLTLASCADMPKPSVPPSKVMSWPESPVDLNSKVPELTSVPYSPPTPKTSESAKPQ